MTDEYDLSGDAEEQSRRERSATPRRRPPAPKATPRPEPRPPSNLAACPSCGKGISKSAFSCPSCGHPIKEQPAPQAAKRESSQGGAAVLSFFFPGVGQIYKGFIFAGLAWMALVAFGYFMFIIPGIILHIICVLEAYYVKK